jgi:T5SS/PEP-CTERM-associated repeat protein
LTVSTGGRFEATELFDVGGISNGTGTLLVTGPDSAVVAADTLRFGRDGDARVTIENGGAVTGGASAYIALTSTSASTVNVQSGGVWSVGDSLFVGGSDIAAGGLASGQTLLIAGPTTLAAPLRLNGGTLSVHSVKAGTEADFTANLDWDAGTLHFTGQDITIDDGELFGDTLIVAPGKGFIVNQTTTNNGAIHVVKASANFLGGLVNNADLVLSESAIGGPVNSPAGSTVTVLGTVTFRDLLSGGGDFFGPGTAVFAGGQAPGDSPARVSFEGSVEYAVSNSLEIELGGLVWQSGFGSGITHPEGDADRDGDVDGDDFLRWQSQFGSGAGSAASQPVPEPAAVGLIVLLFSAAACRRGRRFGLRHFVIRH